MRNKPRLLQQRVHRDYLLREAEHFRDHKKGIPEWLKNSDDSYIRHEEYSKTNFSDIPILLNFNKKEISCLDFGGADSKDMIEHIPFYGSPEASTQGRKLLNKKVSGGHGNGGKYYALSQFKECMVVSYFNGKLTTLRLNKGGDFVDNEEESVSPWEVIKLLGIDKWEYFDRDSAGKKIFHELNNGKLNLFCWKGIDPRDKTQIVKKQVLVRVLSSIANHPQSRSALRIRNVIALSNGEIVWKNMKPEEVVPDETFGIKEFYLPNELPPFKFNSTIKSSLKIMLSKEPLTGERSSLNILEIDAFGRNIAYYDLPTLMLDKGISKSLYAYIDCPELKESNCVSNDRVRLIENEMSALFLGWCKSKIKEVLEEISSKEKKREERQHLEELGTFLKELTEEIQNLLEEENLLKPTFKQGSSQNENVSAPTNNPGFGGNNEIKKKGGGLRKGGKEIREAEAEERKSKSKLSILLSNHDEDPLNRGKTYDMHEREPILLQRVQDVDYGIWWINSQKNYVKKIKIKDKNGNLDPAGATFYFFLIKDILLSNRIRRRFKEQDRYDPDGLEETNFNLIDEIFNKTVERLGVVLSTDQNMNEKIRESIRSKEKFTVSEISKELLIDPVIIHVFISNPSNGVLENFKVFKEKINGKGNRQNTYIRK